jgi:hypothetical protein
VQDQTQGLTLELREHCGALLGGQDLEQNDAVLARRLVEQLGDVSRMQVLDRRRQFLGAFADQFLDIGSDDFRDGHRPF